MTYSLWYIINTLVTIQITIRHSCWWDITESRSYSTSPSFLFAAQILNAHNHIVGLLPFTFSCSSLQQLPHRHCKFRDDLLVEVFLQSAVSLKKCSWILLSTFCMNPKHPDMIVSTVVVTERDCTTQDQDLWVSRLRRRRRKPTPEETEGTALEQTCQVYPFSGQTTRFLPLLPVYPLVLTIVLPGVFVMAHLECCCETVTPIFATSTNLPVSDFQTWQVCFGTIPALRLLALVRKVKFHIPVNDQCIFSIV